MLVEILDGCLCLLLSPEQLYVRDSGFKSVCLFKRFNRPVRSRL